MSFLEAHLFSSSYPAVSESFNFRIYCRGHTSNTAGALSAVSGSEFRISVSKTKSQAVRFHFRSKSSWILHACIFFDL